MLRVLLAVLLMFHGMVHFTGLARAFLPAHVPIFKTYINKSTGLDWALAGTFFVLSGLLLLLNNEYWWGVGGIAILISQVLIVFNWHDARFGTVANVILAIAVYIGMTMWDFQERYITAEERTREQVVTLPEQHVEAQYATRLLRPLNWSNAATVSEASDRSVCPTMI